jgi:hypothetical protein
LQKVEVPQDKRALREDREGVAEVTHGLEDPSHQLVASLGALIRVHVGPHRDVLVLPALGSELLPQQLGSVDLDHDLGVEVLAVVEVEVGMGLASEAVDTLVLTSAVWIDRPAERDVRRFGDAIDDRLGAHLVERHALELRRVEGPHHRALLE